MKKELLLMAAIAAVLVSCGKKEGRDLYRDGDGYDDYDLPEVVVEGVCENCYGNGVCISCHGSGECSCNNGKCSMCGGDGKCSHCDGTGKQDCIICRGTGYKSCTCSTGKCPSCHGSGKILDDFNHSHTCSTCHGTGKHQKCDGTGKVKCTSCNGKGYKNCDYCFAGSGKCISCSGSGRCHSCNGSEICKYCGGDGICSTCGGSGHIDGAEDHTLVPLLCGGHRKEWFAEKSRNPQTGSLVFSKYGRAYRLNDGGTVCSACYWTGGYRKSDEGGIAYIINMDDASIMDPSLSAAAASFEIAGISSTLMEISVSGSENILRFTTSPGSVPPDPEEPLDNALSGEFSVSTTKKVHFSKGNLVATIDATGAPTAWKFATNQYDYIGEGGANKTIGVTAGDVDFFGWSTASTTYGISTSTFPGDYSWDFVDWGKAYCEKNNITPDNTWRTLTTAEWQYLFNTRTVNGSTGADKSYSLNITYGGKMGVVLYPDNYTGSTLSGTVTVLPEGVVFLPAAGRRDGSSVNYVGDDGLYWSSTAYDSLNAYGVYFISDDVYPGSRHGRDYGYSVRLVTESK